MATAKSLAELAAAALHLRSQRKLLVAGLAPSEGLVQQGCGLSVEFDLVADLSLLLLCTLYEERLWINVHQELRCWRDLQCWHMLHPKLHQQHHSRHWSFLR